MRRNITVHGVWSSLWKLLEVPVLTEQGLEACTTSSGPSVRCYLFLVTVLSTFFMQNVNRRINMPLYYIHSGQKLLSMRSTLSGWRDYQSELGCQKTVRLETKPDRDACGIESWEQSAHTCRNQPRTVSEHSVMAEGCPSTLWEGSSPPPRFPPPRSSHQSLDDWRPEWCDCW